MKTTKHTRPALQRRPRPARKAQRLAPKDPEYNPQPATRHHDFLALCLYPGMGDHSTAA